MGISSKYGGGSGGSKSGGINNAYRRLESAKSAAQGHKGILHTLLDNPVGGGVLRLANIADILGSGLRSAVNEGMDAFGGTGGSPSFNDFLTNARNHVSMSEYLGQGGENTRVRGASGKNILGSPIARAIVGSTLDIGLDPITYTGVGAIETVGGKAIGGGARSVTQAMIERTAREVGEEAAGRLYRRGLGALSKAEREAAGLRGAATFLGKEIPGTSRVVEPIMERTAAARGALQATDIGRTVGNVFDARLAEGARDAFPLRDENPLLHSRLKALGRRGRGKLESITQAIGGDVDTIWRQARRDNPNFGPEVTEALRTGASHPVADTVRAAVAKHANEAAKVGIVAIDPQDSFRLMERIVAGDTAGVVDMVKELTAAHGYAPFGLKNLGGKGGDVAKNIERKMQSTFGKKWRQVVTERPLAVVKASVSDMGRPLHRALILDEAVRSGTQIGGLEAAIRGQLDDLVPAEAPAGQGALLTALGGEPDPNLVRSAVETSAASADSAAERLSGAAANVAERGAATTTDLVGEAAEAATSPLQQALSDITAAHGATVDAARAARDTAQSTVARLRAELKATEAKLASKAHPMTQKKFTRLVEELEAAEKELGTARKGVQAATSKRSKAIKQAGDRLLGERDHFDQVVAALDGDAADLPAAAARQRELAGAAATAEEADARTRAAELLDAAAGEQDTTAAHVARLEAQAEQLIAAGHEAGQRLPTLGEMERAIHDDSFADDFGDAYLDSLRNFVQMGDYAVHPEFANAVRKMLALNDPSEFKGFVQYMDNVTNFFRKQALLRPGFHARNFYGGAFNNWMAGMPMRFYAIWTKQHRAFEKGLAEFDGDVERALTRVHPKYREAMRDAETYANFVSGITGRDVGDISKGATGRLDATLNPTGGRASVGGRNLSLFKLNEKGFGFVERHLRGPLWLWRHGEGGLDDAIENVAKFHFDYAELSKFERNVMRRIFPFYTWTRKNFPLQLEQMLRHPGKYTSYFQLKRNLEGVARDDDGANLLPSSLSYSLALAIPWLKGGAREYLGIGLPFADVNELTVANPVGGNGLTQLGSMTNPILQTAIEQLTGKSMFTGEEFTGKGKAIGGPKPLVDILAPVFAFFNRNTPGVNRLLPNVRKDKEMGWVMDDRSNEIIQDWLPVYSNVARAFPQGETQKGRTLEAWLSLTFGTSFRPLDDPAKYGAIYERVEAAEKMMRNLGIDPSGGSSSSGGVSSKYAA